MIPVSVVIAAKNEEANLAHSLPPLIRSFDEVIVLDSGSADKTCMIAEKAGAKIFPFHWNGRYPKKRQWSLENIPLKREWVFFVDADEIVTDDVIRELQLLDWAKDGYFVPSKMVWKGKTLNYGMRNNKLCLFRCNAFRFPEIDDLDIEGMGEIEGHYQPVPVAKDVSIGQIRAPLVHHDRKGDWQPRHERYAQWEAEMSLRKSWPVDPVPWRERAKLFLRGHPWRPALLFSYGYVWKRGFMDGKAGLDYALARAGYARRIGLCMQQKIQADIDGEQNRRRD